MKDKMIYEGKAKRLYEVLDNPNHILLEYKDSLTAFNALKKGSFEGKGSVNRDVASLIFQYLKKNGVESHWIKDLGTTEMLVQKLKIIPIEVVVRNVLAGSTAKKFGFEEGRPLANALVEFYYKSDELQDPFLSNDQAVSFGYATEAELQELKKKALELNQVLIKLFKNIGIQLVDFKVEFGKASDGKIVLADEITPDCCRLWDLKTGEKLDKDRFRRDLGKVSESYMDVLERLKGAING
jgi:phosphoribosylaminoimidazole-succinocarboxamide synthase